MKISGFLEKKKPCINQILIKQGDLRKEDLIIIVHKGEFRITKNVQDTRLAHPISQTTLVHKNLIDQKAPVQTISLALLSKGCFTGLEDRIYGNDHYSLNVECASNKGTIYIITGRKLDQLQRMTRIWSQVIEQMDKNCDEMQQKYACILRSRSKFPFGKR